MEHSYSLAYWGLLAILVTVIIQSVIAASSKASRPGAIPGKIDPSLSHDSFIFRSNRTFANSLENLPLILGASFLALFVEANPLWTGLLIATIAVARIIHMILYYAIATEKIRVRERIFT